MSTNANTAPSDKEKDAINLSQLLKALGAGARAVQALPLSSKTTPTEEKDSEEEDNHTYDEFAFESSFPEFSAALSQAQDSERNVLVSILQEISSQTTALDYDEWESGSTADLFELSATACDLLLEQIELYLNDDHETTKAKLSTWSQSAREKSTSTWQTIVNNTVDMEKPQQAYNMAAPCNSRTQVFVPAVHPDKPFAISKSKKELVRQEGHGHDTAFGTLRPSKSFPSNVVAPTHHMSHYYQAEIEALKPSAWEFEPLTERPSNPPIAPKDGGLSATWIDTPKALAQLGQKLAESKELDLMVLDLEAHSYHSFAGMVCLMQLTALGENFLIDTLKLSAKDINRALQAPLANPAVVKVLHGADSDVQWLQRDFGLYIVHLFDTGRAARALNFSSASYAYLLKRYCDPSHDALVASIVQDKQHFQLSDWRQRPLPDTMQQYAIADTHYLLYIAYHLKWELQQSKTTSVEQVLEDSRKISLIRYPGPSLFVPTGYQILLAGGSKRKNQRGKQKHQHRCTPLQEAVLAALWDWRDATAREKDECTPFICPNNTLLRLAMAMPQSVDALTLNQKLPSPGLEFDLVKQIQKAVASFEKSGQPTTPQTTVAQDEDDDLDVDDELENAGLSAYTETGEDAREEDTKPSSHVQSSKASAFFRPQSKKAQDRRRRGMMSPVLGTEALYRQAGWMTPSEAVNSAATPSIDDEEDEVDHEVEEIHTTASEGEQQGSKSTIRNQISASATLTPPASAVLNLKGEGDKSSTPKRGRSKGSVADGFASARAAREASKSPVRSMSLEDDAKQALESSLKIRSDLQESHQKQVRGLLSAAAAASVGDDQDDENANLELPTEDSKEIKTTEEEFSIPRSMREIYKISNRNRRQKKSGSPTPERGATPTDEKELDELQKAEALLRERGMDAAGFLFQTNTTGEGSTTSNKKAKSGDHNETPAKESRSASKEDDIAFFRSVGWVSKEETDSSILNDCYAQPHAAANMNPSHGSAESPSPYAQAPIGYDYSQMGATSLQQATMSNNPFFSGAALQGGPLAQNFRTETTRRKGPHRGGGGFNKSRGRGGGGGNNSNTERPEKRDGGRSHVYRNNRS